MTFPMFLLLLTVSIVFLFGVIGYLVYENKMQQLVLTTSARLHALIELNSKYTFYDVPKIVTRRWQLDTKPKYDHFNFEKNVFLQVSKERNEFETLLQLTKDHSMVQEMVEQGALTEEEAQNHPRKNLITRALGVGRDVEADFGEKEVSPRDILLLCSDGLSNCVSVPQIEETLARTPFYEAADALVQKALEGGGLDNITVLLMQVEAVEENNG